MAMAMAGGQKKSDGRKKKGNEAVRSLVRIFLPIIKAPPPPPLSAGSELCIGTEMEVRSRLLFTCQVISGSRRASERQKTRRG